MVLSTFKKILVILCACVLILFYLFYDYNFNKHLFGIQIKTTKSKTFDDDIKNSIQIESTASPKTLQHEIKTATIFDKIQISNIFDIHIDKFKSATYYITNDNLIIAMLFISTQKSQITSRNIKLSIELEEKQIFFQNVNVLERIIYSNGHYTSSYISKHLLQSNITSVSRLTFQFIVNDEKSDKFPIKIVDHRLNRANLTARLIKCLFISNSILDDFDYILSLIVKSNYDSIYICIFKADIAFKQRLDDNALKLNKEIRIFELENLPNVLIGSDDFRTFNDCINNPKISNNGELFDPVLEFLLNLKYPSLVEKYKYVHAADFDHILFTNNNKSMFEFIEDINAKNNFKNDVSLYFNQYWALSNVASTKILESINSTSLASTAFPILVKSVNFDLLINDEVDLEYATKIANHVAALNVSDKFRQIILMVKHQHLYGQTVHNTRSSIIVKLCGAGLFFPGGIQIETTSSHMIHYREEFGLTWIAKQNRITIRSFITWHDLHFNFTATYEKYKVSEQCPY